MGTDMVGPFVEMHDSAERTLRAWDMVGQFWFVRDYGLFALMAGVRRNEERPVMYEPRGMPPDVGRLVGYELRPSSVWNPSWLNTWEARAVAASYFRHREGPVRVPMQLRVVLATMKAIERYGRAARIVFAFDDDG